MIDTGAVGRGELTPPATLTDLGEWIDRFIQEFAAHPDEETRERVFALLDGVDALHRAALVRLAALLREPGNERVWVRARDDRVIRTVLQLYDLLPEEPRRLTIPLAPIQTQEAAEPVRTAELEWRDALPLDALPEGTMRGVQSAGVPALLCNPGGEIVAWRDACPDTPLALSLGEFTGSEIVCPWHGCRFDARSGERLIHRGTGLAPLGARIERGVILIGTPR